MSVDVIVGLQRGDEGKGRFVDMLAEEHDIVARFNGGSNAGHTVVLPDGRDLALHQVPSGIAHEHTLNVIGNGTLVNPSRLVAEIKDIESKGIAVSPDNLLLSSASHLTLPHHIYEDELHEAGSGSQGSTKAGIAQTAAFKALREGIRTENVNNNIDKMYEVALGGLVALREQRAAVRVDLLAQGKDEEAERFSPINEEQEALEYIENAKRVGCYVTDTVLKLNKALRSDKPPRVLAEGAQAFLLDIDHGMYPFVSSSSTTSAGAATGLGIPPYFINHVYGVVKAVPSHVGKGPFVTEELDPLKLAELHGDKTTIDAEVGTTTGRIRRLGCLDLPLLRRANLVNGTHEIVLSKLDWIPRYGDQIPICTAYKRKGRSLAIAPDAGYKLAQSVPIYEYLPSWQEDLQNTRQFEDLPKNAQSYVEFIEEQTGVPIKMIGVGPSRDQVIIRR